MAINEFYINFPGECYYRRREDGFVSSRGKKGEFFEFDFLNKIFTAQFRKSFSS
jgi:hypothetical protein